MSVAGLVFLSAGGCAGQPAFQAVSIRPHLTARTQADCGGQVISGNQVTVRCTSLRALIMRAYDVRMDQISGGPDWLSETPEMYYDITAVVRGAGVVSMKQLPFVLQALLADRFQLRIHRETKEVPVFALVVAEGGPKFRRTRANSQGVARFRMGAAEGSIEVSRLSMDQLAKYLSSGAGQRVVDQTGLTGEYQVKVEWSRDRSPSIFTAVEEQLGLKLEPTRGLVETIIVDHAEKPPDN
jgi:uncharacterized protein (TIGR03435 family)